MASSQADQRAVHPDLLNLVDHRRLLHSTGPRGANATPARRRAADLRIAGSVPTARIHGARRERRAGTWLTLAGHGVEPARFPADPRRLRRRACAWRVSRVPGEVIVSLLLTDSFGRCNPRPRYASTAACARPGPAGGGGGFARSASAQPLVLMVLMFGVFYFLLIRPQQKRQREPTTCSRRCSKGDKVRTSGGIRGEILESDRHRGDLADSPTRSRSTCCARTSRRASKPRDRERQGRRRSAKTLARARARCGTDDYGQGLVPPLVAGASPLRSAGVVRLVAEPRPWVPAPPAVAEECPGRISPGLDIQGGLRLTYEVEVDEAVRDRRDLRADELLRELGSGSGSCQGRERRRASSSKVAERVTVKSEGDRRIRAHVQERGGRGASSTTS